MTLSSPLLSSLPFSSPSKALEREFCKEFECCSSNFAGLHDLLAHYESDHHSSTKHPLLSTEVLSSEEMLYTSAFRASGHGPREYDYAPMVDICAKRAVVDMADPEMDSDAEDETIVEEAALGGLKRRPSNKSGVEKKKKRKGNDSVANDVEATEDTDIDILTIDDEDLLLMKVDGLSLVLPPTPPISEKCMSPGMSCFLSYLLVPDPRFALIPPPSSPSPLLVKKKSISVHGLNPLPPPIPKIKKVRQSSLSVLDPETGQRKYICAVTDCGKQYKNANGLKYHLLHAHPDGVGVPAEYHELFQKKKEDEGHRPYTCSIAGCEKKYKNLNGLKVCSVCFLYRSSITSSISILPCYRERLKKRKRLSGRKRRKRWLKSNLPRRRLLSFPFSSPSPSP